MKRRKAMVPLEDIQSRILLIRGEKVMIDADLAELFSVPTKALNQAVKRNIDRFPADFMFRLTKKEKDEVVTICDHLKSLRYSPSLPYAFAEHGAIMLASVLSSPKAVEVSILVVRAFVKLRQLLSSHKELFEKLRKLEMKYEQHDQHIVKLYRALRELMEPEPKPPKRQIGFRVEEPLARYKVIQKRSASPR